MTSRPHAAVCAERLRAGRLAAGLSQRALAKVAGLTQSAIANYEHGARYPDPARAVELARCLGVSAAYLLGVDEESTLTDAERDLLAVYRAADDRGRAVIDAVTRAQVTKCD